MKVLLANTALAALAVASIVGCSSSSGNDAGSASETQNPPNSSANADAGTNDNRSRDGGAVNSSTNDSGSPTPPTTYTHVLINFDDLADGTSITTQYAAHATFASSSGCASQATANADFGQSLPNYVTTYFSCATGDTAPVMITFAQPVKNITLSGIGVNASASERAATFKITHSDGTSETMDWMGAGDPETAEPLDLTKYSDVVELDFVDVVDAYGIGYDDLAFDFPDN
jgi:hypothetical protein